MTELEISETQDLDYFRTFLLDREERAQPLEMGALTGARQDLAYLQRRSRNELILISNAATERMMNSLVGQQMLGQGFDELELLEAIDFFVLDVLYSLAFGQLAKESGAERAILMPRNDELPPTLMLLSTAVQFAEESSVLTESLTLPIDLVVRSISAYESSDRITGALIRSLQSSDPRYAMSELFAISRPEVMLTRQPKMERLCAPAPCLIAESNNVTSTLGIFCEDGDGDFGATACLHGTGDVGTDILIEGKFRKVKHANQVQDIVFIPLPDAYRSYPVVGLAGVRCNSAPAVSDHATFDGAVNGPTSTRFMGTDPGLLRSRPNIQLRVQTGPDTDQGDSGCALVDAKDQVVGFAFERTAPGDFPEFTDWIWAANALESLKLTA